MVPEPYLEQTEMSGQDVGDSYDYDDHIKGMNNKAAEPVMGIKCIEQKKGENRNEYDIDGLLV